MSRPRIRLMSVLAGLATVGTGAVLALGPVGVASAAPSDVVTGTALDVSPVPLPALGACLTPWTTVILGTAGPDVLVGTPGPDLIIGFGGDDVIVGGGGIDKIHGGRGNDLIDGNTSDDCVVGAEGEDTTVIHMYTQDSGNDDEYGIEQTRYEY